MATSKKTKKVLESTPVSDFAEVVGVKFEALQRRGSDQNRRASDAPIAPLEFADLNTLKDKVNEIIERINK